MTRASSFTERLRRLEESTAKFAVEPCDSCSLVPAPGPMRFATVESKPDRCPECGAFEAGGSVYSKSDVAVILAERPDLDREFVGEPHAMGYWIDVEFRGPLADLWRDFQARKPAEEYVVEGSAGTGKTFLLSILFIGLGLTYPGSRWFIGRATRASMTDSVLQTFEAVLELLGLGMCLDGPQTKDRTVYLLPNGSEIVPIGLLDRTTKMRSSEWDGGWINEASEMTFEAFDELARALRGGTDASGAIELNQPIVIETNPDVPHHWINQRPIKFPKAVKRVVTRHADNPRFVCPDGRVTPLGEKYLSKLERMSPVRRNRLLLGLWVQAEGLVFDCWDPAVHVVKAGRPTLARPWGENLPEFAWYLCGQDFGAGENTPGSLSLYGVTPGDQGERKMYRLRQWYGLQKGTNWFADRIAEWADTVPLEVVMADNADPGAIRVENERLMLKGCKPIVQGCDKRTRLTASCDLVRDLMFPQQKGGSRIFFVEDGVLARDQRLVEKAKPTCTEEEIPSYVWREAKEGHAVRDEPAPGLPDHGIDDLRYAAMHVWKFDLSELPQPQGFDDPKTAEWLGDDEDE